MAEALKAMEGLTFGADPELFVINSDEEFICPEMIPGTKEEPFLVEGGAVQRDGMAAEFNIDPVTNYKDWSENISGVQKQLSEMLPSGCKLVATPSATFSKKVWDNAPEDARELGCSPDYNAWTGNLNPPPQRDSTDTTAVAGGHIHFGWTKDANPSDIQFASACCDLVKQLDWYLGAWSLRADKDKIRRNLYGKAGSMRFKPYGVEYRTLSNFWLASSNRKKLVWDRMQKAIHDMRNVYYPEYVEQYQMDFNERLIKSINNSTRDHDIEKNFRFPIFEF